MSLPKKKYYAVARGRRTGIYLSWFGVDGAEKQIKGYPGALFRGFPTRKEAEDWLQAPTENRYSKGKRGQAKTSPEEALVAPAARDIVIYTDGSSLNNPGPGGYGVVIIEKDAKRRELSEGFRHTTNNRMEMLACIVGLRQFKKKVAVSLYSDSKYVINGITKGWARNWRARGWLKSDGKKALNPDLWEIFLELCEFHDVHFQWVKGHAGNPENERCDELANQAAAQKSDDNVDHGYEAESGFN